MQKGGNTGNSNEQCLPVELLLKKSLIRFSNQNKLTVFEGTPDQISLFQKLANHRGH
jgi:hypothetical protein